VPYERKGKDIAVNYCITRIVAGTNHSLKILPYDKALMKRIVLVPMMISVDEDKQDPELLDKLWDEKDAIVTRLLGVLTTLSREHFKLSQCDLADQMKEAWEKESIMTYADGSVRAFVEENCVVDNMQESYSYVCDLYDAYSEYCLKIGENRKLEEASFSKQVRLLIDISCNQKANERKRRPGAKNALHIVRGICLKGGN
jgi:phage/plasmid-associated DNA primase